MQCSWRALLVNTNIAIPNFCQRGVLSQPFGYGDQAITVNLVLRQTGTLQGRKGVNGVTARHGKRPFLRPFADGVLEFAQRRVVPQHLTNGCRPGLSDCVAAEAGQKGAGKRGQKG